MPRIYGETIDNQTRCTHYHTSKDIIAIKFRCCNKYYPCCKCHDEKESHDIEVWKKEEFAGKAILCGVCKEQHTINQYLATDHCIKCNAPFNEGCRKHYHLYFESGSN